MRKILSILAVWALCLGAKAQIISGVVALTNAPVNGSTLTVNGTVFTWTNNAPFFNQQYVFITNSLGGDATNLASVTGLILPFVGVAVTNLSTNVYITGSGMTASVSASWATLTLTTNTVSQATNVVVPVSSIDSGSRAPLETGLWNDINQYAATPAPTNSVALSSYVPTNGLFLGAISNGIVTNAQQISGNVFGLTNGYWLNGVMTNGQNFGNPFRSPGSGTGSEQFGLGASANQNDGIAFGDSALATGTGGASAIGSTSTASSTQSSAVGFGATASGAFSTSIGSGSIASGLNSSAFGIGARSAFNNSTAIGKSATSTVTSQIMVGTSSEYVEFPGNVHIAGLVTNLNTAGTNIIGGILIYPRTNNVSLANGANAGVFTGTNFNINVSGPSAAFSIAGLTGGVDDREIRIENKTGFAMTINNASGLDPTAANRILTGSGADLTLTNNPTFVGMKYNSSVQSWEVTSINGSQAVGGSGSFTGSFSGNGSGLTNISSTGVSFQFFNTNFANATVYTNLFTAPILLCGLTASFGEAAVAGRSSLTMTLTNTGGVVTNISIAQLTAIGGLSGAMSNAFPSVIITNGGTWSFSDTSTGAGNTATPVGGQVLVY